ncbi:MAG: ketoacyl-ACP synthase III [Coxiellaceae bacterium]|jgi:3-oxoacyl-[acyl-carrier-protein] synthase-3|nr:ketoacyl-ACP synthase III [Coxiellaceae bacterium]
MAGNKFLNIRLAGLASAVPDNMYSAESEASVLGKKILRTQTNVGVKSRFVSSKEQCTSDLCFEAAKVLLNDLGWNPNSVGALIFVTQTPDHILPATSCILQSRLHLSKSCAAFDVNIGCSGYVYGLWLGASLITSGINRVLVLVGDTITKVVSPLDATVATIIGDAGTASALEYSDHNFPWCFELGTDGGGAKNLMIPAGLFRVPHSVETAKVFSDGNGNKRSAENLYMNGLEVFDFASREIPGLVGRILAQANCSIGTLDGVVLHQASKLVLQYLCEKLKIPPTKLLTTLEKYGSVSSASIPLTITDYFSELGIVDSLKLLLVGFGAGYSWAGVVLNMADNVVVPKLIKC